MLKKKTGLVSSFSVMQVKMLKWDKQGFGNIFTHKMRVLYRLQRTQHYVTKGGNPFLYDLEKNLTKEYNLILSQEEIYWF